MMVISRDFSVFRPRTGMRGLVCAAVCAIAFAAFGMPGAGVGHAEAKSYPLLEGKTRKAFEHFKVFQCGNQRSCGGEVITVPNNRRLELKRVSCSILTNSSTELSFFSIFKPGGSGYFARTYFPFVGAGPNSEGHSEYTINEEFFMIAEAGQTVQYDAGATEDAGQMSSMACRVTGEIVKL